MKNLISTFVLLLSIVTAVAQEKTTINSSNATDKTITTDDSAALSTIVTSNETLSIDKVCYSEASKVAFYEVLISKNGFDIQLKESDAIAIKNTEEIISKNKDQILYSEED